ncbi:LLM class flavin-dependent oxidoreductase [Micromonospora sp. NPDC047753]|uniref:LLM class flavin-dependent oxidoreductase n=1 Tax=Micromonospora sp. NPDC047753 TaxID=3154817 RepID=UPI0034115946
MTSRVRLGTTVLIVPYRHPLLTARMAANLNRLSGGRLVLGVGVGWARQEFEALGVPFRQRGALTDEYLHTMRAAWQDTDDYDTAAIPIWVGGNSEAGMRRAVLLGDAWHPLRVTPGRLADAVGRLTHIAGELGRPVPALVPRIAIQETREPITDPDRLAGVGTIDQIVADLDQLRVLGAETVVLDPFNGDLTEIRQPERAWRTLAAVAAHHRTQEDR